MRPSENMHHQDQRCRLRARATGRDIENTGEETLIFLALFRSDHYADVSLARWMDVTPPELVKAHLNLHDAMIAGCPGPSHSWSGNRQESTPNETKERLT